MWIKCIIFLLLKTTAKMEVDRKQQAKQRLQNKLAAKKAAKMLSLHDDLNDFRTKILRNPGFDFKCEIKQLPDEEVEEKCAQAVKEREAMFPLFNNKKVMDRIPSLPSPIIGQLEGLVMLLALCREVRKLEENPSNERVGQFLLHNPRVSYVLEAVPYFVSHCVKLLQSDEMLKLCAMENNLLYYDALSSIYRVAHLYSKIFKGESTHRRNSDGTISDEAQPETNLTVDEWEKHTCEKGTYLNISKEMTNRIRALFGIDIHEGAKSFIAAVSKPGKDEEDQTEKHIVLPHLYFFKVNAIILEHFASSCFVDWTFDSLFAPYSTFQQELAKQQFFHVFPQNYYYAQQFCNIFLPLDQKDMMAGFYLRSAMTLDTLLSFYIAYANRKYDITDFDPSLREQRDKLAREFDKTVKHAEI